jgi:cell division protein FtsB
MPGSRTGRAGKRRTWSVPAGSAGRSRLLLLGAVVASVVILVAWFPMGSLVHQGAALAEANGQLAALHRDDAALNQEKKSLSDPAEIGRIARAQYQLVSPGQQAYEVLPPASGSSADTPYAGDPGLIGPVAPSAAAELPPGGATTTTTPTTAPRPSSATSKRASDPPSSGMLARMLHTLEFWR